MYYLHLVQAFPKLAQQILPHHTHHIQIILSPAALLPSHYASLSLSQSSLPSFPPLSAGLVFCYIGIATMPSISTIELTFHVPIRHVFDFLLALCA